MRWSGVMSYSGYESDAAFFDLVAQWISAARFDRPICMHNPSVPFVAPNVAWVRST